jgi:uncharacterized protein (TIGR02246 family)
MTEAGQIRHHSHPHPTRSPIMSTAEPQAHPQAHSAIEALSRNWKEAFDAKDADAAFELYRADAALLAPGFEPIQGAEGIRGFIEGYFQILVAKEEMLITELEPMGEHAFETGSYRGVHLIDGQTIPDRGKYMRIWTREQDGSWKIYREMFNDSPL